MTLSLPQAMAIFEPSLPITVAYSGGADSSALLLACVKKWPHQVRAVHVHHGLQAAADGFEQHCRATCAAMKVPLRVQKVDGRAARGDSPEDAARRARYKAFETLAVDEKAQGVLLSIAIAQHADDQVETLLLALSRGAGLPGLSAMPQQWQRAGVQYHRPLLQVSGIAIREWLAAEGLPYIEDPSNSDETLTRNRIRARLMPALQQCFASYRDTLARSARHAAQAQALLQEVAQVDLAQVGVPPNIRALQILSEPRLANVLRHWLLSCHQARATAAQLAALMRQIAACTTRGHRLHLKVANGFCFRNGDVLHWYNPAVLTPEQAQQCP